MLKHADIGKDAIKTKGRLRAHQWLILRRLSQVSVLLLFLLGPLAGVWIIKGNLLYDNGFLRLLSAAWNHRLLISEKFSEYFVAYGTFGSWIKRENREDSDKSSAAERDQSWYGETNHCLPISI